MFGNVQGPLPTHAASRSNRLPVRQFPSRGQLRTLNQLRCPRSVPITAPRMPERCPSRHWPSKRSSNSWPGPPARPWWHRHALQPEPVRGICADLETFGLPPQHYRRVARPSGCGSSRAIFCLRRARLAYRPRVPLPASPLGRAADLSANHRSRSDRSTIYVDPPPTALLLAGAPHGGPGPGIFRSNLPRAALCSRVPSRGHDAAAARLPPQRSELACIRKIVSTRHGLLSGPVNRLVSLPTTLGSVASAVERTSCVLGLAFGRDHHALPNCYLRDVSLRTR